MGWVATVGVAGSSANSNHSTITSLVAVPVGDAIIIAAGSNGKAVSSVSDSKGNTYTIDGGVTGTGTSCYLASTIVSTALAIGDTITVNFAASVGGRVAVAEQYTGVVSTSPADTGADGTLDQASGTSASITGAGNTAQASELLIMATCIDAAGTANLTATSPLTMRDTHSSTNTVKTIGLADTTLSSVQTPSAGMTWTGSVANDSVMIPYKLTGGTTFNQAVTVTQGSTPTVTKLGEVVRAISAGTTPATTKQAELPRSITAGSTPTLPKQAQLTRLITAPSTATLTNALIWAKAITATVGNAVTRLLQPGKVVSVSEGSTLTLPAKAVTRTLTFTAPSTPSVVKQIIKALAVSAGSTASLGVSKLFMVAISVANGYGFTLTKQADKPITVPEGSTMTAAKAASKTLSVSAGSTSSDTKQAVKPLTFTVATTASLVKQVGKIISSTGSSLVSLLVSGPGGPVTYLQDITVTAASSVSSVYDHFVLHSAVLFTTETGTLSIKKAVSRTLTFTASKVLTLLRGIYYHAPDPENNVFIETSGNAVGVSESENTITITEG